MIESRQKAPDFTLPMLDGGEFHLADALRDGPVLLVFFKRSCPTCQLTLPYVDRIARGGSPGARILLISQDGPAETKAFHQQFGITLPTLIDAGPQFSVSNAFAITSVPSFFQVEQDGLVSIAETGFDRKLLANWGSQRSVETFLPSEKVPAHQFG